MAKQGKKHMGGRRRYEKLDKAYDKAHGIKEGSKKDTDNPTSMRQVPASRVNIKAKTPVAPKKPTGKGAWSTMADQPTRKMLGIKIVKGGK